MYSNVAVIGGTTVCTGAGHNPADVSDHWPLMAELSRRRSSGGTQQPSF
jgi:hypothetical protein